jgi:hypothetical protein
MSRKLFVDKVFELVNDPSMSDVIHWSEDGSSFVISDGEKLVNQVFPELFKHNSMDSFVRQLHHYGFKKNTKDKNSLEFSNAMFIRGRPELISSIKRKGATAKSTAPKNVGVEVDELLAQIDALKSEKESLQSENDNLREKYMELVTKYEPGDESPTSDSGHMQSETNSGAFFGNTSYGNDFVWNTPVKTEGIDTGFNLDTGFDWSSPMEIEDLTVDSDRSAFEFPAWNSEVPAMEDFGHSAFSRVPSFGRITSNDLNDPYFGMQVKIEADY